MSQLRRNAREARELLGDTGTVVRVASLAKVYPHPQEPGDWMVGALDSSGDGGIYTTVFSGPNAKERALEYAQAKYAGAREEV